MVEPVDGAGLAVAVVLVEVELALVVVVVVGVAVVAGPLVVGGQQKLEGVVVVVVERQRLEGEVWSVVETVLVQKACIEEPDVELWMAGDP